MPYWWDLKAHQNFTSLGKGKKLTCDRKINTNVVLFHVILTDLDTKMPIQWDILGRKTNNKVSLLKSRNLFSSITFEIPSFIME
jgi:hypothetical protein